jgi:catechol 2,3-dioxygenase-like lactoylglutathione lyase family enzyme
MREPALNQKTRFVLLLLDLVILCVASWFAFGTVFPASDDKGFWFYTALLGLLLGSRLDTPFFAKPADVVLYAAPAAIALVIGSSWAQWSEGIRVAYSIAMGYCIVAGLLGVVAILTVDSKSIGWQRASNAARVLAETLGAPRTIYSVVIGFAVFAFHRSSPKEFGVIVAAWVLTGVLSPLEGSFRIGRRLRRIFKPNTIFDADGEVIAYQTPGLILVRQFGTGAVETGDVVAVQDPLGKTRVALALDNVGRDEGVLLRTIEIADAEVSTELRGQLSALLPNAVVRVPTPDEAVAQNRLVKAKGALVGLVAPDTSVERLFFEVVKEEGLEEGRLVEVQIGKRVVTYQLVNGLTKEEVVQHKNTHGFARAQAQKIGEWDESSKRFSFVKWLPAPNAPVFLKSTADFVASSNAVGHFPRTNYPVSIKSIDELITHNTAILGILGVGKSMLAIELVERMLAAGIKVICLDLTNQYSQELAAYYDGAHEEACLAKIQEAGEKDREAWADNPEEGGSIPALREAFHTDLVEFLADDNPRRLKIYNPSQVVGSKQLSEPKQFQTQGKWQRGAALWGVTPVEVTRMVSETALALLQGQMSSKARVCLVYEEAHSLIPEFSAVASPSDREASNGTARAILQGRKFGLGCLVVTQRTANVTKTILNQCNTVFAMRTFDETGKEFLANYIGKDYAASLSSISERHAVLFGKASSCENPILIRLNDRQEFRHAFRAENPPPPKPAPKAAPASAAPAVTASDAPEDDIPF